MAVFSEIFYPYGWTAYVDGAEAPCFRADYVLRAMRLPAGHAYRRMEIPRPGMDGGRSRDARLVALSCSELPLQLFILDKRGKRIIRTNNIRIPPGQTPAEAGVGGGQTYKHGETP